VARTPDASGQFTGVGSLGVHRLDVQQITHRLTGVAQDFSSSVQPLLARIQQLEGKQPWGADEAGAVFLTSVYNHPLDDGTPISAALREALARAGQGLGDFDGRGQTAMRKYGEADHLPIRTTNSTPA
jgi:hypothetical protein